MKTYFIVFPNQLFKNIEPLKFADEIVLIEEFLFFRHYKFHKQKLVLHRASMKYYEGYLLENGVKVTYIDSNNLNSDIQLFIENIKDESSTIMYYDVCDDWLEKRIRTSASKRNFQCTELVSSLFINSKKDLKDYFEGKKKFFHNDFYILQRKKLNILMDESGLPLGGKWSYDSENRSKYPLKKIPPKIDFSNENAFYKEAIDYVQENFPDNLGCIDKKITYPYTHQESEKWLNQFLELRLEEFGIYEDAIVDTESYLHHSVLTPMLNIGLLTPVQILDAVESFSKIKSIPLNSHEGFIRQIIGWREFIRGVYIYAGKKERTTNFFGFKRRLPESFYSGNTGVKPLDITIAKLLKTAYNHHIERLMLLGNFMLLSEFDPNDVYQWFMEMYIDAYDWVMVPNVYGMSQFADGGIMSTKPYISGSNYVIKMSNYKKDEWCKIWDSLFWNFLNNNREIFKKNPRMSMLISTFDKMTDERRVEISNITKQFLT